MSNCSYVIEIRTLRHNYSDGIGSVKKQSFNCSKKFCRLQYAFFCKFLCRPLHSCDMLKQPTFRIAENENSKLKNFTASVLAQTHSPFKFQKTEQDGIIAKSLKEARSVFQWGFDWFGLFTAAHLDLGLGLPWQPARTGGRAWGGRKYHLWRG